MTAFYADGIGGSVGDSLVTAYPLLTSGNVWYVDSQTGNDTYSGLNRAAPFATLAAALGTCTAGDIIACLDGHTETLTAVLDIDSDDLTIIGEGSDSGVPTVTFGLNASTGSMFTITSPGTRFINIKFADNTQETDAARVVVTSAGFQMRSCYLEMGNYDTDNAGIAIHTGASHARFESTTFISTATSNATLPAKAIDTTAAVDRIGLVGVVFSGGTNGWSGYACTLSGSVGSYYAENVSLLLGADISVAETVNGFANVAVSTGGGRIDIIPGG
jgi:uncharacterized protein with GYD domain